MNKRVLFGFIVVVLLIVAIIVVASVKRSNPVLVIDNESQFSNLKVEAEKVYIECIVTLENISNEKKVCTLFAKMKDGLLKSKEIYALNIDGQKTELEIEKYSKKVFEVVFIGEVADNDSKHDGELPNIKIRIVD